MPSPFRFHSSKALPRSVSATSIYPSSIKCTGEIMPSLEPCLYYPFQCQDQEAPRMTWHSLQRARELASGLATVPASLSTNIHLRNFGQVLEKSPPLLAVWGPRLPRAVGSLRRARASTGNLRWQGEPRQARPSRPLIPGTRACGAPERAGDGCPGLTLHSPRLAPERIPRSSRPALLPVLPASAPARCGSGPGRQGPLLAAPGAPPRPPPPAPRPFPGRRSRYAAELGAGARARGRSGRRRGARRRRGLRGLRARAGPARAAMATRKAGSRLETEIERCRTECQWERIPELVKQLSAKLIANGTLGCTGAAGPRRPPGLGPRRGARAGARPGGEAQAARCARGQALGERGVLRSRGVLLGRRAVAAPQSPGVQGREDHRPRRPGARPWWLPRS